MSDGRLTKGRRHEPSTVHDDMEIWFGSGKDASLMWYTGSTPEQLLVASDHDLKLAPTKSLILNPTTTLVVTSGTAMTLTATTGDIAITATAGTGAFSTVGGLTVSQTSATGAAAVLTLSQSDTDQPFIELDGDSAGDLTKNITTLAAGAVTEHFRVKIDAATTRWIPLVTTPS